MALEVARGKTFHDVMIVKGRYGVLQNITLYCILSATNAARIYILSYAILYREIARVFVSFLGGGGGGFWAGGPGQGSPPPIGSPGCVGHIFSFYVLV